MNNDRKTGEESILNVACCQIEPKIGMTDENLDKTLSWIEKAAAEGANLLILPELCVSGYVFNSRIEAFQNAEAVPGGKSVNSWVELASQHDIHLVAGIAEKHCSTLYNTSVLIGPKGYKRDDLLGQGYDPFCNCRGFGGCLGQHLFFG